MAEIDPVILQLRLDNQRYLASLRSTTSLVQTQLGSQQAAITSLERQMQASSGQIGSSLKGIAGVLATYFTGRELGGIIERFGRMQNELRVAGVEAENFTGVQDKLFASAQRYGVSLSALSGLFGTLTQASKELGASQEQVFQLTDTVSAALKVSGTSASEAQGALLQLGQALRGGKVQAEEYNSLIDGLFPLLQAAANGSDAYGGSVAKLTAAVKDGKVTSQEFFQAILAGSASLESQAEKSVTTLSGAYTQLTNALDLYVGRALESSGVSAALTEALASLSTNVDALSPLVETIGVALVSAFKTLGDNINIIIPALAVLATGLGVGLVTNAVLGSNALFALQARLLGAATSAEALAFAAGGAGRSLLAAFGGPVGIAITAITVAVGYYALEAQKAAQASAELAGKQAALERELAGVIRSQKAAAAEQDNLTKVERAAMTQTAALTGEANLLSQAWGRVATSAKSAAVEQASARANNAAGQATELAFAYKRRREAEFAAAPRPFAERGMSGLVLPSRADAAAANLRARQSPEMAALQKAVQLRDAAQVDLRRIQGQKLAEFKVTPPAGGGGGGGGRGTGGRGSGARGTSASSTPATDDVLTAAELIKAIRRDLDAISAQAGSTILTDSARLEEAARQFQEVIGREGLDYADPFAGVEASDRQRAIDSEARDETERQLQDVREQNVRSLASMYEDLFRGGTEEVWRNFKREGLRTLAIIAAQATIASFSEGGGGIGSLIGNIGKAFGDNAGSFGRASGGFVGAGQLVRVNEGASPGRVEGWKPVGSGTVIPLGQMPVQQGGGGTRTFHITVDARNSVTPAGFADQISRSVLTQAAQMDAQVADAARKGFPAAQERFAQLGTTG